LTVGHYWSLLVAANARLEVIIVQERSQSLESKELQLISGSLFSQDRLTIVSLYFA